MPLPSHWKNLRKRVAERIWDVASWLYPYDTTDWHDDTELQAWEASVTFSATQKDASEIFDRITDVACIDQGHHPLAPCNFMVGGLRIVRDEETDDA